MSFFFQPQQSCGFNPYYSQPQSIPMAAMNPFAAMFGGIPTANVIHPQQQPQAFFPFAVPQQRRQRQRQRVEEPTTTTTKAKEQAPKAQKQQDKSPKSGDDDEVVIEHRLEQGLDGAIYIRPYSRKLTAEEKQARDVAAERQRQREAAELKRREEEREAYRRHVEEQRKQQEEYQRQQREYLTAFFGQLFGLKDGEDDDQKEEEEGSQSPTPQPTVEEPTSVDDDNSDEDDDLFNPFTVLLGQSHPFAHLPFFGRPHKFRHPRYQTKAEKGGADGATTTTTTTTPVESEKKTTDDKSVAQKRSRSIKATIGADGKSITVESTETINKPDQIEPQTKIVVKTIAVPEGAEVWDVLCDAIEQAKQEPAAAEAIVNKHDEEQLQIENNTTTTTTTATEPAPVAPVEPTPVVTEEVAPVQDVKVEEPAAAVVAAVEEPAAAAPVASVEVAVEVDVVVEKVQQDDEDSGIEYVVVSNDEEEEEEEQAPAVEQAPVVEEPQQEEEQQKEEEPSTTTTADDLNDEMLTKLFAQTEALYNKRSALLTKIKQADGNANKVAILQSSLKQLDKLIEQTHQYTQELLDLE